MQPIKPRKEDLLLIADIVNRKPDTIKRIIQRQGNYKEACGPVTDIVMLAWQKVVANRQTLQKDLQELKQQYGQFI